MEKHGNHAVKNKLDRIIRVQEMAERLGVTDRTIRNYEHNGTLPPREELKGRKIGWRASTISELCDFSDLRDLFF